MNKKILLSTILAICSLTSSNYITCSAAKANFTTTKISYLDIAQYLEPMEEIRKKKQDTLTKEECIQYITFHDKLKNATSMFLDNKFSTNLDQRHGHFYKYCKEKVDADSKTNTQTAAAPQTSTKYCVKALTDTDTAPYWNDELERLETCMDTLKDKQQGNLTVNECYRFVSLYHRSLDIVSSWQCKEDARLKAIIVQAKASVQAKSAASDALGRGLKDFQAELDADYLSLLKYCQHRAPDLKPFKVRRPVIVWSFRLNRAHAFA